MSPRAKCSECNQKFEFERTASERIECPHCGVVLRAPAARRPGKPDPLVGKTLGQYEILAMIGRGGMGAVYKARQTSLDRVCGVKVLPRAYAADPSFLERFRREARGAAAISHPSVIQVYDVGQERGFHFIVMEFVEGDHLGKVVERDGRLPVIEALGMLKQVASALAAAHNLGIVHRDIKPSNLLLQPNGVVKVADFGLAKRSGMDINVTAPGTRLGTPHYMPPEVAHGQPADARSDLYSLGATFYHLCSGRCPVEGKTAAKVIHNLLHAEPPPLDEVAPDVPPKLRRVIQRLIARDPEARYQSARELLDALEGREPEAAEAPPTPKPDAAPHEALKRRREAAERRRRRNLVAAVIAAVALLAAIVALVLLNR